MLPDCKHVILMVVVARLKQNLISLNTMFCLSFNTIILNYESPTNGNVVFSSAMDPEYNYKDGLQCVTYCELK